MAKSEAAAKTREERQNRVAKVVWGLLFLGAGLLFMSHDFRQVVETSVPHPAEHAVDGKDDTRWSSQFQDPQWLMVDLGEVAEIRQVTLRWEDAFAKHYQLLVSDDANSWKTVAEVTNGDGRVDEHHVETRGRYVRVVGLERGTGWGYSLWELEVYGPAGTLLSQAKPAAASSLEKTERWYFTWFSYWPALLIAMGLPALLVPKNSADQVMGVVLTGIGAVLLLNNMNIISWGFKEALPILLIVAGALLVLQSLRRANGDNGKPGSEGGREEAVQ